ncbi:MAG: cytochrome C [Acidobacteria bacterium]|nr:MAG: cytochrome C [Acidobacteriota bacterium]
MSRLRDALIRPVIFVVAILTIQTIDVVSWPAKARQAPAEGKSEAANTEKLLADGDCRSCHAPDRKVVGPSYSDIARRYAAQADAVAKLARSIRQGGSGNWGNVSMTPHPDLKDEQLAQIVGWILSLKDAQPAPTQPEQAAAKQYKYSDKKVAKDIFRGYQIYNSYCYRCHGTDATTSELAPDLRRFTEAGTTPQDFLSVAMAGREEKGMPSWAGFLSEEDVRQIYRYVKGRSLELVPTGRPPSEYD